MTYYHFLTVPEQAAGHAAAALAAARPLGTAPAAGFAERAAYAEALVLAGDAELIAGRADVARLPAAALRYAEAEKELTELAAVRPPTARLAEATQRAAAKVRVQSGGIRFRLAKTPAAAVAAADRMWDGLAGYDRLLAVYPHAFPYQIEKLMTLVALVPIETRLGRTAQRVRASAELDALHTAVTRGRPEFAWVSVRTAAARTGALIDRVNRGDLTGLHVAAAELTASAPETARDTVAYDLACVYSRASAQPAFGPALGGPAAAAVGDRLAATAVERLAGLVGSGYYRAGTRTAHIDKDTDLDPLRGRADFQRFRTAARAHLPEGTK